MTNDTLALVLLIGILASGAYLIHSMTVTKSLVRVRIAVVVSLIFVIAFWIVMSKG